MSAKDPDALPAGYADVLDELRTAIRTSRVQASRAVNTEMVALYWRIDHTILQRQQEQGWGARVIERLSVDLRTEFPGMRGLSPRSLVYMRTLAAADERPIAQQPAAQLPWGHVTTLLDRLRDDPTGSAQPALDLDLGLGSGCCPTGRIAVLQYIEWRWCVAGVDGQKRRSPVMT